MAILLLQFLKIKKQEQINRTKLITNIGITKTNFDIY